MQSHVSPLGRHKDALAAVLGTLTQVGEGAYRQVFTDARGEFVYKVQHYDSNQNENEHEKARKARADGIPGVPRTYLWWVEKPGQSKRVPVLCMRKYPGPTDNSYSVC